MVTLADVRKWVEAGCEGYEYLPAEGSVRARRDPQVTGTFAVRFNDLNEERIVDLLFITGNEEGTTDEVIERTLEEVEFSSWPPKSGDLQFFT